MLNRRKKVFNECLRRGVIRVRSGRLFAGGESRIGHEHYE